MINYAQRSLPPLIRLTLYSSGNFIWINPMNISYVIQEDADPKGKVTVILLVDNTDGWIVHETPAEIIHIISDSAKEFESYA
jgi:hypothetical protein